MFKKLISAIAALVIFASANAQANLIIAIDQTGANDPVNVSSPRAWNFGITSAGAAYFQAQGITFDSALFDAKDHNDTTAPLVFSLYSGLGGNVAGNRLITSLTVPSTQFNNQYLGGKGRLFTFTPEMLTAGYYSVTLTSTAPNKATEDYFLKEGKLTLLESNNLTTLNSSYWVQDNGTGNATSVFNGNSNLEVGQVAVLAPEPPPVTGMLVIAGLALGGVLANFLRKEGYVKPLRQ